MDRRLNFPRNFFSIVLSFAIGALVGCSFRWPIPFRFFSYRIIPQNKQERKVLTTKVNATAEGGEEEERFDIPENAPDHCPGIESSEAGKSEACAGCPNQTICASGEARQEDPGAAEVKIKLSSIKKKILVLSGKGGVGKSTVSSQLSWALQNRGYHVGLLDIDVCGPSIPMMTGCKQSEVHSSADGWSPVYVGDSLAVMSIGFLLPSDDAPVIWRGPKKNGLIRQFLTDVIWGDLDFLIIDTPPGTSDEHLSIVTYLKQAGIDGAIVVTTPQEVALQDVRKEINFCKKVDVPILGLIENLTNSVFDRQNGAAKRMCVQMEIPYSGNLPMDQDLLTACESGRSLMAVNPNSIALKHLNNLVDEYLKIFNLPSPITT